MMKVWLLASGMLVLCGSAAVADWPQWRGAGRDGKVGDGVKLKAELGETLETAWKSVEVIPSNEDGGHGSPVVAGGRVYLSVVWHRDVPTERRKVDRQVMRKLGNGRVGLGEEVMAKLEADRQALSPRLRGTKLDAWVTGWMAENLSEDERLNFDWWVKGRFKQGRTAIPLEELDKLTAVQDRVFESQGAFETWLDGQGFAEAVRQRVLAAVPATEKVAEDVVVCVDGESGETAWRFAVQGEATGRNSSSTPAVVGGRVYSLGSEHLYCVSAEDGSEVWRAAVPKKGKGAASSPLVVGSRVVVLADELACYDAESGELRWTAACGGKNASPVVVADGVVACNGRKGLNGFDLETGEGLWTVAGGGDATPVVSGEMLVVAGKDKPGGLRAYRLSDGGRGEPALVWSREFKARRYASSPVVDGGYVYYLGSERHLCVRLADGEVAWEEFRASSISSPLLADGKLMVFEGKAKKLTVLAADPAQYRLLGQPVVRAMNCPSPVVSGGRLFVRVEDGLVCYDLRAVPEAL